MISIDNFIIIKKIIRRIKHVTKLIKKQVLNWFYKLYAQKQIKDKDFTIICNNCYAGHIYEALNIQYRTPTIGLYFFAEDYIDFLISLKENINSDITFISKSRHKACRKEHEILNYPIGLINEKIEVHFLHYKTKEEALNKWNRRKERINWNKLLVIMNDQNDFKEIHLEKYDKITYPKVFLSAKPYNKDYAITINYYKDKDFVGDMYNQYLNVIKDFNLIIWIKKYI